MIVKLNRYADVNSLRTSRAVAAQPRSLFSRRGNSRTRPHTLSVISSTPVGPRSHRHTHLCIICIRRRKSRWHAYSPLALAVAECSRPTRPSSARARTLCGARRPNHPQPVDRSVLCSHLPTYLTHAPRELHPYKKLHDELIFIGWQRGRHYKYTCRHIVGSLSVLSLLEKIIKA